MVILQYTPPPPTSVYATPEPTTIYATSRPNPSDPPNQPDPLNQPDPPNQPYPRNPTNLLGSVYCSSSSDGVYCRMTENFLIFILK